MTSFVVRQTLYTGSAYYAPPRYYELADGSLSMDPVRRHMGTPIYSAEKLLVDIERHLDKAPTGKGLIITRCIALEEADE